MKDVEGTKRDVEGAVPYESKKRTPYGFPYGVFFYFKVMK